MLGVFRRGLQKTRNRISNALRELGGNHTTEETLAALEEIGDSFAAHARSLEVIELPNSQSLRVGARFAFGTPLEVADTAA